LKLNCCKNGEIDPNTIMFVDTRIRLMYYRCKNCKKQGYVFRETEPLYIWKSLEQLKQQSLSREIAAIKDNAPLPFD